MALNARGFFDHLRSYLNMGHYATEGRDGKLLLKEKIFTETKKQEIKVHLIFSGEAFAIKLDKLNQRGNHDPLFHFLDDTGKPWSKRCDFVVFQLYRNRVNIR